VALTFFLRFRLALCLAGLACARAQGDCLRIENDLVLGGRPREARVPEDQPAPKRYRRSPTAAWRSTNRPQIVEYLDEQYASGKKLIPGNARQRALIRRLVREADEYFAHAQERLVSQVLFTAQDKWDAGEIGSARKGPGARNSEFSRVTCPAIIWRANFPRRTITLYPMIALCLRMEKKKPDLDVGSAIGSKLGAWMKRIEALAVLRQGPIPPHWKAKP